MSNCALAPRPPAFRPDPPTGPAGPRLADHFQIGPMIARGGSGSILQAEDLKLKRTVALKVLNFDAHADETMRQRFVREAELLAMLAHPNIVPVYDLVWENGMPLFYSMKLVKGRTLQAILNDLRQGDNRTCLDCPLDHLLGIFLKICEAVTYAHSKGVLHLDLKPGNVMIGEFGEVLVMDWGSARPVREETADPAPEALPAQEPQHLDAMDGTPEYMSPEQVDGQMGEINERSDVYALGGILRAMLAARPHGHSHELAGGKPGQPDRQHPPPPRHGPAALWSVAGKALQTRQNQRYPSVAALAADIQSFQRGFATLAEDAGTLRQLELLLLRHRAACFSLAVLLAGAAISNLVTRPPAFRRKRNRNR